MTTRTEHGIDMSNIRKMSMSRWTKLADEYPIEHPKTVHGHSPGGACTELGISRQAVHAAVKRGDLDAVIVHRDGEPNKLAAFHITLYSIRRYKDAQERMAAARTNRLIFADD